MIKSGNLKSVLVLHIHNNPKSRAIAHVICFSMPKQTENPLGGLTALDLKLINYIKK